MLQDTQCQRNYIFSLIFQFTEEDEEDETIMVTEKDPYTLSNFRASIQQAPGKLVNGAKEQCQKMLANTQKTDDKVALINNEESDEYTTTDNCLNTDVHVGNDCFVNPNVCE